MTHPIPGHLLIDDKKIAKTFQVKQTVHRPIPYPANPLRFDGEFSDREKVEKAAKIQAQEVPVLDQHDIVFASFKEGLDKWFNSHAYGRFAIVSSVVRSPVSGRLQMYYYLNGMNLVDSVWEGGAFAACYAESDNGIAWDLPKLNRVRMFGSKENNIMWDPGCFPYVVIDEHDPDPNRRYKALIHPGPNVAFSPDGINWSKMEKGHLTTAIGRSDGDTVLGWDPRIGKYVAYFRPRTEKPGDDPNKLLKRKIGYAVSDDFIHWGDHKCVFTAKPDDGPWNEFERMLVFRYGDLYFGQVLVLRGYEEERIALSHMLAPGYTELVWSRDGVEWHRFEQRDPFLSHVPGVRDMGLSLVAHQPVVVEGQLYFYYASTNAIHGEFPFSCQTHLARLDIDRFVGWRAEAEEGFVQTAPFQCPGGHLIINADVRAGSLRVAVIEEDGANSLEHSVVRSIHLQGDAIEHCASWQKTDNVEALKGKTISLKFYLRNAEVFSYRFAGQ
jgi:hypothetical protein